MKRILIISVFAFLIVESFLISHSSGAQAVHQDDSISLHRDMASTTSGSRIMMLPFPQGGHFNSLWQLALQLRKKGHDVTMFTLDSILVGSNRSEEASELGIKIVSLGPGPTQQQIREFTAIFSSLGAEAIVEQIRQIAFVTSFLHKEISQTLLPLLQERDVQYDMIISDFFTFSGMDAAHILRIPHVIFTSVNGPHVAGIVSQAHRVVASPYDSLPWNSELPLLENIKRATIHTLLTEATRFIFEPIFVESHQRVGEELGIYKDGQNFWEAHRSRPPPLVLVTSVPGLAPPMTYPPHIRWIGASFPVSQKLSKNLAQWLDQDSKPVVYMSMGTSAVVDKEQLRELYRTARELVQDGRFRVVWSLRESMEEVLQEDSSGILHEDIRIEKHVPQSAVLRHPNVRLFISHCGFNSLMESIYWSRPIVCIPFFGDQYFNAVRVMELEIGAYFDSKVFTSTDLVTAVMNVDQDVQIAENVERMSRVVRAGPNPDYAVREIETILHIGSTGHLKVSDTYDQVPMIVPVVLGAVLMASALASSIAAKNILSFIFCHNKKEAFQAKYKMN